MIGVSIAIVATLMVTSANPKAQTTNKGGQSLIDKVSKMEELIDENLQVGDLTKPSNLPKKQIVQDYLMKDRKTGDIGFVVDRQSQQKNGDTVLGIAQMYRKLPVYGGGLKAVVAQNGVLKSVAGEVALDALRETDIDVTFRVDEKHAVDNACNELGMIDKEKVKSIVKKMVYVDKNMACPAYNISFQLGIEKDQPCNVIVDGQNGKILSKPNNIQKFDGPLGEYITDFELPKVRPTKDEELTSSDSFYKNWTVEERGNFVSRIKYTIKNWQIIRPQSMR